jgi:hypothetical protein
MSIFLCISLPRFHVFLFKNYPCFSLYIHDSVPFCIFNYLGDSSEQLDLIPLFKTIFNIILH